LHYLSDFSIKTEKEAEMQYENEVKSKPKTLPLAHPSYHHPYSEDATFVQVPQAAFSSTKVNLKKNEMTRRQLYRDRVLGKISNLDVPCKNDFKQLIRYKFRNNCKINTIRNYYISISLFLTFLKSKNKNSSELIERTDLEEFVEHEQDRQIKPSSMRSRLSFLYAFLRYLIENNAASAELLERKIHIKQPRALPRDIESDDEQKILSVVDNVRNRAMILLLLRTGMRIGELLRTEMSDVNLEAQMIRINESEKTGSGRVVYFGNDAAEALYHWLMKRDFWKNRLFYGCGRSSISYTAAWRIFHKYLDKSGMSHKGYTLHCLRHTYATGLLNAGMPIECLRDLLGHKNLKQTLRYAHLSDKTRRKEFFRAMAIIEGGKSDEPDRFNH
jgi:integrase/recombinase XerD